MTIPEKIMLFNMMEARIYHIFIKLDEISRPRKILRNVYTQLSLARFLLDENNYDRRYN